MDLSYLNSDWNVLVVDDSKLNRAMVIKTLAQLNLSVDEAGDGIEALELLSKKQFDLVLLDIIMPRLDGFGFLQRFKKISAERFIPVILMTGSDDLNSKIKGLQIGADDYLLKPLNEKELVARVQSLLRLKYLHDELYEKNKLIEFELDIAKQIQKFIVPVDFPGVTYPHITGTYLPIEDIGGDYYDCYEINSYTTGFLIADVTGHGIPAALIMSMSKMLFSLYAPRYTQTSEFFSVINNEMLKFLIGGQYITAFYVIYNKETGRITFSNAGHTKALYYRKASGNVLALDAYGLFVGIADDVEYEQKSIAVAEGDRLLLYTDGVTELKSRDKEEYGVSRLAASIKKNHALSAKSFNEAILNDVKSFTAIDERDDDIAFLSIEF